MTDICQPEDPATLRSPVVLLHEHARETWEIVVESGVTTCGKCGMKVEGVGIIERRLENYTVTEKGAPDGQAT